MSVLHMVTEKTIKKERRRDEDSVLTSEIKTYLIWKEQTT